GGNAEYGPTDAGMVQPWTATRSTPIAWARTNAWRIARVDGSDPSTPTTTGPVIRTSETSSPAPPAGTTSTGHSACAATWTVIDPRISPANPPRPRDPSTMLAAVSDSARSAAAAGVIATAVETSSSRWRSRTRAAAESTNF